MYLRTPDTKDPALLIRDGKVAIWDGERLACWPYSSLYGDDFIGCPEEENKEEPACGPKDKATDF